MALNYWMPLESKKAKGYFIVRDVKDERRYGSVFHSRLEDAQKACDALNNMIDMGERRRKDNWKERKYEQLRNAETN